MKSRISTSLLLLLALVAFGLPNSQVVRAQDTPNDLLASLDQFLGPLVDELSSLINATDIEGILEGIATGDLGNINITETLETLGDGLQDILGGLGLNLTNALDGGLGNLLDGLNLNITEILEQFDLGDLNIEGLDDLDIGQIVNAALSCNWTQLTPQINACTSSIDGDNPCTPECTSFYETLSKECPALIEPLGTILPDGTCGIPTPGSGQTPVPSTDGGETPVPSTPSGSDLSPTPPSTNDGITKGDDVAGTSSTTMVSGMIVAAVSGILVAVA